MTATYPARTDTAYRGVVYGIDLLDHASVMADAPQIVPDDYVGKTRQRGRGRENQHRDDKPWSDLIVGSSHVLWEGICDEDELDQHERDLIREKRPRMNDKDNRWNRDRIEYEYQVAQRHERDRKFGRPLWQPPELRRRKSLLEWQTPDRPAHETAGRQKSKRRPFKRWQKYAIGWAITWPGSTLFGWVFALLEHWGGWEQTLIGAASLLPGLLLLVRLALEMTASKRTRRKVMRKLTGWPW